MHCNIYEFKEYCSIKNKNRTMIKKAHKKNKLSTNCGVDNVIRILNTTDVLNSQNFEFLINNVSYKIKIDLNSQIFFKINLIINCLNLNEINHF